jgi:hypothetical protein
MTASALIIVLFIFILTGLIVLRPFFDKDYGKQKASSGVYDSLLAEQERLLSAIEELDLDLELKKISSTEHELDRQNLLTQAADVLRELDKYSKPKKSKVKSDKTVSSTDDDLERMIEKRRKQIQAQRTEICSNCGEKIEPGDQFCSQCGSKQ